MFLAFQTDTSQPLSRSNSRLYSITACRCQDTLSSLFSHFKWVRVKNCIVTFLQVRERSRVFEYVYFQSHAMPWMHACHRSKIPPKFEQRENYISGDYDLHMGRQLRYGLAWLVINVHPRVHHRGFERGRINIGLLWVCPPRPHLFLAVFMK